jgi:hypothetical protein
MTASPRRYGIANYALAGFESKWSKPRHMSIPSPADNSLSIATSGRLSISLRIRPDASTYAGEGSTADYSWPLAKGSSSGFYEYGLRHYSTHSTTRPGHLSCYAYNPTGGLGAGARWSTPLVAGTWYHVVVIYDMPADRIAMYVDGVAASSGEKIFEYQGDRIVPVSNGAPIQIGKRGNGADFVGSLRDLRFFGTALTPAEVAALAAEEA